MRILVTGATGHIGNHICRTALERGWEPIAFVRESSDRTALEGLDIAQREGDLLDRDSVERAMDGIDAVMHAGAVHRNHAADPQEIIGPSVAGTENVLAAMKQAGVGRLVFTSSGATVGFAPDPGEPFDESHFTRDATNPYILGKVEAERRVLAAQAEGSVEAVVVNPSGVFGPRDYRLTPSTRAIIGLAQGDPAFLHICATSVADVAEGHALALEKGKPGERYILTGDNLAPKELSSVFEEVSGVRPPTFRPPTFLLRFLAGRAEKKSARDGTHAPITRSALDDLGGGHLVYDSSKSVTELGMRYAPARDVLRDTFRWLLHRGALKPKVQTKSRKALGSDADPDADWR